MCAHKLTDCIWALMSVPALMYLLICWDGGHASKDAVSCSSVKNADRKAHTSTSHCITFAMQISDGIGAYHAQMPQILMVSSAAVERNAMIGDDGGQPALSMTHTLPSTKPQPSVYTHVASTLLKGACACISSTLSHMHCNQRCKSGMRTFTRWRE